MAPIAAKRFDHVLKLFAMMEVDLMVVVNPIQLLRPPPPVDARVVHRHQVARSKLARGVYHTVAQGCKVLWPGVPLFYWIPKP